MYYSLNTQYIGKYHCNKLVSRYQGFKLMYLKTLKTYHIICDHTYPEVGNRQYHLIEDDTSIHMGYIYSQISMKYTCYMLLKSLINIIESYLFLSLTCDPKLGISLYFYQFLILFLKSTRNFTKNLFGPPSNPTSHQGFK